MRRSQFFYSLLFCSKPFLSHTALPPQPFPVGILFLWHGRGEPLGVLRAMPPATEFPSTIATYPAGDAANVDRQGYEGSAQTA